MDFSAASDLENIFLNETFFPIVRKRIERYKKGYETMENTYENKPDPIEEVNPWTSIWIAPRKAIRSAITHKKTQLAFILAMIYGITSFLDRAIGDNLGDSMPFLLVLVIALVGGAIGGLIGWWILSGLASLIGKWLGGVGTYEEMKIAVGVSYIPVALSGVLYVFDLLFLGTSLFQDVEVAVFQVFWLLFSASIGVVFSFWSIFILIKGVAEAHRFSSWKALLTLVLPFIVLAVVIIILFITT